MKGGKGQNESLLLVGIRGVFGFELGRVIPVLVHLR